MVDLTETALITEPSCEIINQRETVNYKVHRQEYLSWYLTAYDLRRTGGTLTIKAGVLPTVVIQAGGW